MSRSFAIISSSGGIAAGSPFVLGGFLNVSQASPPVAQTNRMAIVEPQDAYQSITAAGSQGAAHSFVLGEDAEDSANGARALLIGYKLRANTGGGAGQADDQVLLGNTIQLPAASRNCQGLVAIGASTAFTAFLGVADSFGGSVVIGNLAGLVAINIAAGDASNAVAIGAGALAHGGSVVIGATAIDSDQNAVAIGQGAKAGLQSIAIGLNADSTGARNISLGDRARGGVALSGTIAIGWFADAANSDSGIAIGQNTNLNGKTASIMLGRNAGVALDNFCQIGGDATYPITEMRFGAGFTQATGGVTYTFGITTVFNGAGNNVAGNGLVIRSGLGTGNWNGGTLGIDFQVGLVQAAGSTQQPYTSALAIHHSDLNISLWGGLGATFGAGARVVYLKAAATVPTTNPTGGGLLYVTGANNDLSYRNSAGTVTALTPGGGGGTVSSAGMTAGKIPVASAAQTIGDSILSIAAGVLVVAGGQVSSDNPNTLDFSTVTDAVRFFPSGLQTLGISRSGPDGTVQVYPGATNAVSLGGTSRAFNGLFITGALAITLTNQTTTVGAAAGTLTNAPTVGNPTGYLRMNINGAVGKIPYWV